jgi:hypothetical protein
VDGQQPPGGGQKEPSRRPNGTFAHGNPDNALGGHRTASSRRMAEEMGFDAMPEMYRKSAHDFKRGQMGSLRRLFGYENVGRAAASFVASAAIQLAWSRVLTDKGDAKSLGIATKLANDSKGNLKAAYEMCALERDVRSGRNPAQEATSALAALLGGEKKGT